MLLEVLVISALFGGSMFTWGYFYNDIECKSIRFEIPAAYTREHVTPDCLEKGKKSCSLLVSKPRYMITERDYSDLSKYLKSTRKYLEVCKDTIDMYNDNKYAD